MNIVMANITIRNVFEETMLKLSRDAAANGLSIEDEARLILINEFKTTFQPKFATTNPSKPRKQNVDENNQSVDGLIIHGVAAGGLRVQGFEI